jgi:hypothetical protein
LLPFLDGLVVFHADGPGIENSSKKPMRPMKKTSSGILATLFLVALAGHPLPAANQTNHDPSSDYLGLSDETNSLRSGLCIEGTNRTLVMRRSKLTREVFFVMLSTSTNDVRYYRPRKASQRLQMELLDATGAAVPKTPAGKEFDRGSDVPPNTPARMWQKKGLMAENARAGKDAIYGWSSSTDPDHRLDLAESLSSCFDLKHPGLYTLVTRQRIYVTDTNGFLKPVLFPPVKVPVLVEDEQAGTALGP